MFEIFLIITIIIIVLTIIIINNNINVYGELQSKLIKEQIELLNKQIDPDYETEFERKFKYYEFKYKDQESKQNNKIINYKNELRKHNKFILKEKNYTIWSKTPVWVLKCGYCSTTYNINPNDEIQKTNCPRCYR